jgi:hypothetical protein
MNSLRSRKRVAGLGIEVSGSGGIIARAGCASKPMAAREGDCYTDFGLGAESKYRLQESNRTGDTIA